MSAAEDSRRGTSLPRLLDGIVVSSPELTVRGLTIDSRAVRAGDLFIALRGLTHDGRAFLEQAAQAGAVAALLEEAAPGETFPLPAVVVPRLREQTGEIASRFYAHPSRTLNVTAVTGTNGKTTVSHLLAQLIRGAGYDCGVVGTLGASVDGQVGEATHTTPDAISLQAIFASWVAQAVPFVSMEASSHALDQGRVNGVDIDTAVFTNLTRDHLDYHRDMDAYGAAKARLFEVPSLRTAVLNADDPYSSRIAARLAPSVTPLFYGSKSEADFALTGIEQMAAGMKLRIESPFGKATVLSPLLGRFNALNLLAALTAATKAGLPFERLAEAVAMLEPVPGRMEPLRRSGAPLVVIDYAHTPDALVQVLAALRPQTRGRLVAVFGCGGDRDRGKRAEMAAAVSDAADAAVLTSDNPRSEDPRAILTDVEAGMRGDYTLLVDRAEAIAHAISNADPTDTVLIAGKGHEDYQLIGAERLHFSDSQHAQRALEDYAR